MTDANSHSFTMRKLSLLDKISLGRYSAESTEKCVLTNRGVAELSISLERERTEWIEGKLDWSSDGTRQILKSNSDASTNDGELREN
jgi:hypothetical protein